MSSQHEHFEEFRVKDIKFVGEQDGPPERILKRRLSELLAHLSETRAYLARVRLSPESPIEVAFCLYGSSSSKQLVSEIGAVFASVFGSHEHLNIVFLNEQQDSEISSVCRPFLSSMRGKRPRNPARTD